MLEKYVYTFKQIVGWYFQAVNSNLDVSSISMLASINNRIKSLIANPCKVEILSYYLNLVEQKTPVLPLSFDSSFFWEKPVELFVDIGSGHGELLYAWPQLAKRFPILFFQELIKRTGLQVTYKYTTPFDITSNFFPVVVGFETKSRYYRLLREVTLFEFNYARYGSSIKRYKAKKLLLPLLRCPQWLIYKENGFLATKKFEYNTVSGFFVFFPDPWNKKRHYKRREITVDWMENAFLRLKNTGFILIVTDHPDYAHFIKREIKYLRKRLKNNVKIQTLTKFVPLTWGLPNTYYFKKNIKGTDIFAFLIKKQYQN